MKYRCPNCNNIGTLQGYNANYVVEDSEMCIAKCKSCKKDYSVAFTISQAPIETIEDLEKMKNDALEQLMNGKYY